MLLIQKTHSFSEMSRSYTTEQIAQVLQSLDLGIIECFKQLYTKHLVQMAVCLRDASKVQKKKIDVLEDMHYTVEAWRQVMQQIIKNCFCKAGYGHGQPSDVRDVTMRNEDNSNAFHHDWQKFSGMDNEKFDN